MKTITQNVTVEVKQTQVLGFHAVVEDLDVQPDNKKIIATVNSFVDEASSTASPAKVTPVTIDMVDGEDVGTTVDNYLAIPANLDSALGGTTA